jgi:ribosomal protein S18 acetylase RimI-like enzyme
VVIRELSPSETRLAADALLALRPHHGDAAGVTRAADAQRADGYRLVAAFEPDREQAVAVAGFRVTRNLSWGRHLYVDDLSTLPAARGRGHAGRLLDWLAAEAGRAGCEQLHLDSGVGPDRATAHRLYFNHGLQIVAHHFATPVRAGQGRS